MRTIRIWFSQVSREKDCDVHNQNCVWCIRVCGKERENTRKIIRLLLFTPDVNPLWKVTNLKIFILWIKGVRKKNYVDGFSSWFFFIWLSTFINSNNHYYGISSCFSGSWLCFLSWLSTVIMLWSSFFVTFLANKIKLLSASILAVSATLDNGAEGYYQIVADSDDLKNRFFFLVSVE